MTVSITATPTLLIEEEGTQVAITLTSSEPIPPGGLIVDVDSDVENALGQFDLFTTQFENVQLISINDDISGFKVQLNEQTGTITSPVFDDNDADSPQNVTLNVEPGEGYTVDESAGSVTITIEDADDLSITQQDDNTLISANGSDLAILQGIISESLIADNFVFV